MRLTKSQNQLCNALQEGLPICWRPFAEIAKVVGCEEAEVLQQTSQLKGMGIIRRISALINYRALGMTSTLVTAHVPDEDIKEVAEAINSLEYVSHNYRRNHYYNLWFTLQAKTPADIKVILIDLSGRFGVDFYSLPVKHAFKLDVRFDAPGSKVRCQGSGVRDQGPGVRGQKSDPRPPIPEPRAPRPVGLNENEKLILSKLQDDLQLIPEPFDLLCNQSLQREDVLRIIKELIDKGVIHRIATVVDHRKLGFVANVLFAGQVPQDRIIEAGQRLACFGIVSHCYERETFENWPYNLFAMMHATSMGQIQHVINKFVEAERIDSFQLLPTVTELKKQPVRYKFY